MSSRRILLAWEKGANWGHISRLAVIAKELRARGAQVFVFAAPEKWESARAGLHDCDVFQAPGLMPSALTRAPHAHSFADILLLSGFGQAVDLTRVLRAWRKIFDQVKPDALMLDGAPAAGLAACIQGVQAVQITNGFDAPPASFPIYGLHVRGAYVEQINRTNFDRLQRALAIASKSAGRAVSVEEWFKYPLLGLDALPETDPYYPRQSARATYLGPLTPTGLYEAFVWEQRQADRPRVFSYLRPSSDNVELLKALRNAAIDWLAVCPDASQELITALNRPRVTVTPRPVNLSAVLPNADLVVSYGSTTLSATSMLAGAPLLLAPSDVEKALVSRHLSRQGLAHSWNTGQSAAVALGRALNDEALRMRVKALANSYSFEDLKERQNQFFDDLAAATVSICPAA